MVFWNFPPIPCQLSGSIPQKEKLAKSRVTLDLGFYHFNCRIRPHGWFLFDIQHTIIVWGYNLSYHLEIKANSEGYILEPSQSYTGALKLQKRVWTTIISKQKTIMWPNDWKPISRKTSMDRIGGSRFLWKDFIDCP